VKIPVLLYHGVDTTSSEGMAPYTMAPSLFEAHLDELVARGCTALTISQLVDRVAAGEPLAERTVAITFDDGLADFAVHAWPALRERDLAATLYVVAGEVNGSAEWLAGMGDPIPPLLTWDQVRQLDAEGCEIGAHSYSHPELDTLPLAEVRAEVGASRDALSAQLGKPIRSFAYPHGYHGARVRQAVRDAGFDSACAVGNGLSSTEDDRFAITRITLLADDGVDVLRTVLDGGLERVGPLKERVRTKGWRAYRRTRRRLRTAR
jgi:peptidoglycan/xylan/chitin deacetylase (PgdA/CDA1 family)